MRRTLLLVMIVALACASAALAGSGDPKKDLNAADQARARAMLLQKSDLRGRFQTERNTLGSPTSPGCAGLDESDLTVSGEAKSPGFTFGFLFVSSQAEVYESLPDASTSWRRFVSVAGSACLRAELRREFTSEGLELLSFGRLAFPRVASKTTAYRIVLSGPTQAGSVKIILDLVALTSSRAQAFVFTGSAIRPESKAEEVRLARLVAERMKKAMRGA